MSFQILQFIKFSSDILTCMSLESSDFLFAIIASLFPCYFQPGQGLFGCCCCIQQKFYLSLPWRLQLDQDHVGCHWHISFYFIHQESYLSPLWCLQLGKDHIECWWPPSDYSIHQESFLDPPWCVKQGQDHIG